MAVILIGCVALLFVGPREPSYHGGSLTDWLYSTIALTEFSDDPEHPVGERGRAIRAFGTNALPKMVSMVGSSDGKIKNKLIELVNGQKIIHAHIRTAKEKHGFALIAFATLGTNAAPAAPELIKLTKHSDAEVRFFALWSLDYLHVGEDVWLSVLKDCLQDPSAKVHKKATGIILGEYPEKAEQLGVYQLFPELKPQTTNSPPQTAVK